MPSMLITLNTQLNRMRYLTKLTAAPSRLLGQPNCKPRRAAVRVLATKPRTIGVMIQRMMNATMFVMYVAVPSMPRYSPKKE